MDYEGAFLSKIITEDCIEDALDARISAEFFEEHKDLWEYVLETFKKHGGMPPVEIVIQRFPDFTVEPSDTPASFLIEELKKRWAFNVLKDSMKTQAEFLNERDPYSALDEMRKVILKADQEVRSSRDINVVEEPARRVKEYTDIVEAGGITGLPTPWECLNEATQGLHAEELIMLAGRGGTGKCVEASTKIYDPVAGFVRTIEEVVCGSQSKVLSWSKERGICSESITAKVDTGTKRCFKYELENGVKITVTPEHPFLTPDGWMRADLLDSGDYVGTPLSIPHPKIPGSQPIAVVDVLAIMLSEGSCSGNHVGFSSSDSIFIDLARDAARGLGVRVVHRTDYDYDFTVEGVSAGRHTPNAVRSLLKKMGIDRKKSKEKTIPDEVFRLPKSQLARFISIFWMADGYIKKNGPGITLASEEMVNQLQHLLLRFGIHSSVHYKAVKGGFHSWRLQVYSHSIEIFNQEFSLWGDKLLRLEDVILQRSQVVANPNIGGPRWRNPLPEFTDIVWTRIRDVEDAGECKIYDLSVKTTSCFVANDIVVHNTWCESVMATYHWRSGYVPLLFSREMSVSKIIRRIDAVNSQLPYQRFRSGQLTSVEFERWKQSLTDMDGAIPFWVTGDDEGGLGVSGISAKINRYKPDIVYIDGGYLLEDDRGAKASWERWSNVCRDLQSLAHREQLPIVLSHQFNLAGKGSEGNEDTLKYGDVQMWFDLIIGMYRTDDLEINKEMMFKINKQREGVKLEWVTEWDLDKMCFDVKASGTNDVQGAVPYDEEDEEVRY